MRRFMFLVFFLALLPSTFAFGVSPASIDFGVVLPGAYAEQSILVSSIFAEESTVRISSDNPSLLLPDEFSVVKGSPQRLTLAVSPEANLAPGKYEGRMQFSFYTPASVESEKKSLIMNTFSVPYSFTVGGVARSSCIVAGLAIDDFEQGSPGLVKYRIKNTGTALQQQVATLMLEGQLFSWSSEVKPTQEQSLTQTFSSNIPLGEYEATFSVEACDFVEKYSFSVLPPGSLKREGDFSLDVVNKDEDAVLPVSARFENTGEVALAARLSGRILLNEKTVRTFEGESLLVLPGRSVEFTEYVDGLPEGEYVVRAKIIYDGGASQEKEVLAKVATLTEPERRINITPVSFLLVTVPVILLLLIIIREKRRR